MRGQHSLHSVRGGEGITDRDHGKVRVEREG